MTTIDEIMAAAADLGDERTMAHLRRSDRDSVRKREAELRTIITQAIAEARADVWIPIASAPLDGTILQLWNCVTSETDIGHWSVHADGSGGEWSQEMGNGDMTHWRPLPDKREPVRLTDAQIAEAFLSRCPAHLRGAHDVRDMQARPDVIELGKAIETAVLAANGLTK